MLQHSRRVCLLVCAASIFLSMHSVPALSTTTEGKSRPACVSYPVPVQTPQGAYITVLASVSVDEAAGYFSDAQGGYPTSPLIEYEKGSTWVPVPSATGVGNAQLHGVSGDWAVGTSGIGFPPPYAPIIEHRGTNGSWSLVPGADMGGVNAGLEAVAVNPKNPNDAWVVGEGTRNVEDAPAIPVAEHWDGTNWTNESAIPHDHFGTTFMNAVSVLGDGQAWAVGEEDGALHPVPIIAHWTGKHWLQVRDIGANVALKGVAAFPNGSVLVVGGWGRNCCASHSPPIAPLAELWNGKTWTQTPLGFGNDDRGALYAISGLEADNAWAVGSYQPLGSANSSVAISFYWNGSQWTVASDPQAGIQNELVGVAALPGRFAKADAISVGGASIPGGFFGPISLQSEPCALRQ